MAFTNGAWASTVVVSPEVIRLRSFFRTRSVAMADVAGETEHVPSRASPDEVVGEHLDRSGLERELGRTRNQNFR